MSVRSAIEDAVRAWLVAAGVATGVPNADRAVIFADTDAPRPALPCLVVRLLVYDVQVGEDEDLVDDADPPTWRARGQRTGSISVNAYGTDAEAWLERATLFLRAPSRLAALSAAGVALRPDDGGLRNLSALLDDTTQARFQRDFAVDYERVAVEPDDTEGLVELAEVVHEDTWQGDPDDRVETVTEVL